MKNILLAAAIFAGSAALLPLHADAAPHGQNVVIVKKSPPALKPERVPNARRGQEWVPGYWNWSGNRHVWVAGHWEKQRAGHVYRRPEWRHNGNGWYLAQGGWEANRPAPARPPVSRGPGGDRDRDGVPNRVDNRPNDPYRR